MKKKLWFLPSEVVIHNKIDDLWIIINKKIFNLTSLIEKQKENTDILPILAFAGKDISHWFDVFGNFKTYVHPVTGLRVPHAPYGPVLHYKENFPEDEAESFDFHVPWWKDNKYVVGFQTVNARPLRIINSLTDFSVVINVCEEETFYEIAERYKTFNSACLDDYSWWYLSEEIDMSKTLLGNNINDDRVKFRKLAIPDDFYVPAIILIYQDECTLDCQIADSMDSLRLETDMILTSI